MTISTRHPLYDKHVARWKRNRDALDADKIRDNITEYLPRQPCDLPAPEADALYAAYAQRAIYVEFTERTKSGLMGAAFRKDPQVMLPESVEYLELAADKKGRTLITVAKEALEDLIVTGRHGLLIDVPPSPGTDAEATKDKRAHILGYMPEAIINWHHSESGDLDLLVLEEVIYERTDYEYEEKLKHIEYFLVDNSCFVRVWIDEKVSREAVEVTDYNGKPFESIPFVFIGANDNDSTPDKALIQGIADVNIGHFVNSADYEDGIAMHGRPFLFIDSGEEDAQTFREHNESISIGTSYGLVAQGGDAKLLQSQANSAAHEAMRAKETQMVMIGARIIESGGQAETAEAARIKYASENGTLSSAVNNCNEGMLKAIWYAIRMMTPDDSKFYTDETNFEISTDFYDRTLDSQSVMAQIQLYDRMIIGKTDLRNYARKAGAVEPGRTDQDIEDENADRAFL